MAPTTTREKLLYFLGMIFLLIAGAMFFVCIRTGQFRYLLGGAVALAIGSYML